MLLAGLAAATGAGAAEFDYGAEAGLGYSDNIRRVSSREESETIGSAELDFSLKQKTSKLLADLAGDATFFDYFGNTYDSEVVGNFAGLVSAQLIPERFEWVVEDNFGQVRSDPFAPVTPDNRENVNFFSTGPIVTLRFGSQTGLRLTGRYSNVSYEDTEADSNRYYGGLAAFRNLSSASVVSLNATRERIDFDSNVGAPDYDRDEAYLRYQFAGARTDIGADLGYARVVRESGDDDGWLGRLTASRKTSASSTVSLELGHEFSDSGQAFRQEQGVGPVDAQTGLQTANPFTSEYVRIAWNFARQRTGFGVSIAYRDEKYVASALLDETRTYADAYYRRDMTPRLTFNAGASYAKNDFKHFAGDYDETGVQAGLLCRLGRKLWLGLSLQHFTRDSDIVGGEYNENRAWLRLRYGDTSMPRTASGSITQSP